MGINTAATSVLPKLQTSISVEPNPEGAGKKIKINKINKIYIDRDIDIDVSLYLDR